jgi:hypothetical protein
MQRLFVITLLACMSAVVAAADVITFDPGFGGPVSSVTIGAVTFSAVGGGGQLMTLNDPNGTNGLIDNNSPRKEIRAAIAGGTTSVSVDLGDFDADADLLVLRIYDPTNTLINSTSLLIDAAFVGLKTLSLSGANIAFAEFGAESPALNGSSVFADNFTFTPAAVPEPGSVVLLLTCVLGILGMRSRVRSKE